MNHNCCSCSCSNKNKEGFFKSLARMPNDSKSKTLLIALILCLVCSLAVSLSVILLRDKQAFNKEAYKNKNILIAAGLPLEASSLDMIETKKVNLKQGDFVDDLADNDNVEVYLVKNAGGEVVKLILPISGRGAWSTLYGFIVVYQKPSNHYGFLYNEVADILFYEQGETPGLGGEVENPRWRANWQGKEIYDDKGNLKIEVIKGIAPREGLLAKHQVDGLAGATVTTRYVNNLVRFWLGDNGFKKFLMNLRKDGAN